jgi:hypothetical protein
MNVDNASRGKARTLNDEAANLCAREVLEQKTKPTTQPLPLSEGVFSRAKSLWIAAIRSDPDWAVPYFNLAKAYIGQGQLEIGKDLLKAAVGRAIANSVTNDKLTSEDEQVLDSACSIFRVDLQTLVARAQSYPHLDVQDLLRRLSQNKAFSSEDSSLDTADRGSLQAIRINTRVTPKRHKLPAQIRVPLIGGAVGFLLVVAFAIAYPFVRANLKQDVNGPDRATAVFAADVALQDFRPREIGGNLEVNRFGNDYEVIQTWVDGSQQRHRAIVRLMRKNSGKSDEWNTTYIEIDGIVKKAK